MNTPQAALFTISSLLALTLAVAASATEPNAVKHHKRTQPAQKSLRTTNGGEPEQAGALSPDAAYLQALVVLNLRTREAELIATKIAMFNHQANETEKKCAKLSCKPDVLEVAKALRDASALLEDDLHEAEAVRDEAYSELLKVSPPDEASSSTTSGATPPAPTQPWPSGGNRPRE